MAVRAHRSATARLVRRPAQRSPPAASFDHLVSEEPQARGNFEPERSSSAAIDHELELGGLLDRQIGRLGTLEYLVDISGEAAINVREARPIKDQSAGLDELASAIDRRQPVLRGKLRNRLTVRLCNPLEPDHNGVGSFVETIERTLNILAAAYVEKTEAPSLGFCCRL